MVNLEALEQACLEYLKEVSRPLVPVDQLLRHLGEERGFIRIQENELVGFLRKHELFTVIDPIGLAADPARSRQLRDADIHAGASVILSTRIPARNELAALFDQQIETLCNALQTAMQEAPNQGHPELARELMALLDRTRTLRERLNVNM